MADTVKRKPRSKAATPTKATPAPKAPAPAAARPKRICDRCQRPVQGGRTKWRDELPHAACAVAGYVVHEHYGCDSGCCGHTTVMVDASGRVLAEYFQFEHCLERGPARDAWIEAHVRELNPRASVLWDRCDVDPVRGCDFL